MVKLRTVEFKNWFSFDDFVQKMDENSEKTMILVENFVKNR